MEVIKTINLTKKYKDLIAVDSLSLEIYEGELFSLLGINGAGKTTLIRMLSTLTRPTCGELYVLGRSALSEAEGIKPYIGVSPQETAVAPGLTVLENLEFMCGVYGFSGEKTKEKTRELSEKLGLFDVLSRRAGKLSGGYRRRLSIAMALIGEPKILFLDEPTLGLDVIARAELWEVIRSLKKSSTVILTTHYMEEAEALSDRVGIMKNGHILAVGTPSELVSMTGGQRLEDAFISIVKGEGV